MAKDCWQKSSASAASSKGSPSSGSNSQGYPKGAPKGKGKGTCAKGTSKGKMKGKQRAMAGEEQVTDVTEETWQEDDGRAGQWPEGEWEEPREQGAMGAMSPNEGLIQTAVRILRFTCVKRTGSPRHSSWCATRAPSTAMVHFTVMGIQTRQLDLGDRPTGSSRRLRGQ